MKELEKGLSIIICSISQEKSAAVQKNIEETIGVDCEFISIDNAVNKWSIAKVYNMAASQSQYPYLLFIHEDTRFLCSNWGRGIIKKLAENSTGVIGFAGGKAQFNSLSSLGWACCIPGFNSLNFIQGNGHADFWDSREDAFSLLRTPDCRERDFSEVVVLDGMAMFVRRELWEKNPFDEKFLTGFHCYDIDFTLVLHHNGFKNYICTNPNVVFLHDSEGTFSNDWFLTTINLYEKKWNRMLPACTSDVDISFLASQQICRQEYFNFIKKAIKESTLDFKRISDLIKKYECLYENSTKDGIKLYCKYFWYRGLNNL